MLDMALMPGPEKISGSDLDCLESSEKTLRTITDGLGVNFGLSGTGEVLTHSVPDDFSAHDSTHNTEDERLEEFKQGLFALGYLSRASNLRADRNSKELISAARTFRQELAGIAEWNLNARLAEDPDIAEGDASETELALLTGLISLDGDLVLPFTPRPGEQNLVTRIIHYRLKILGLYEFNPGNPYDRRTEEALTTLVEILRPSPLGRSSGLFDRLAGNEINVLGDVELLARIYQDKFNIRPLFFRGAYLEERPDYAAYDELYVYDGKFEELDWFEKLHARARYDLAKRDIGERGPLAGMVYDFQNEFGLRLVQIKLWMYGYYDGFLDGLFGEKSQVALRQALETENLDIDDALRTLDGGFEAINLSFLNQDLFSLYELSSGETLELTRVLERESTYLLQESEEDSYLLKIRRVFRDTWEDTKRIFRGAYRGLKSTLLTALRVLQRGYAWLARWLGNLGAGIVSFFNAIFSRLRESLRLVVRSAKAFFNFVLGRPFQTLDDTGRLVGVSRFSLDADVITLLSSEVESREIQRHCGRSLTFLRNVNTFADITVQVISLVRDIALSGTPVSWISLGFRIVALIKPFFGPPRPTPA